MSIINEIISNYEKICCYGEKFWKKTKEKYPTGLKCSRGCSACCELQSVNYLEGFVIAEYCKHHGEPARPPTLSPAGTACAFLSNDQCRIYHARPLICRTHGLLLKSRKFSERIVSSCLFNFTAVDHAAIDDDDALDTDIVTLNLAKLNAAFCLYHGNVKKAEKRIALRDLASGKIGRPWFAL
jgi:Fe-S-cluster containining protein